MDTFRGYFFSCLYFVFKKMPSAIQLHLIDAIATANSCKNFHVSIMTKNLNHNIMTHDIFGPINQWGSWANQWRITRLYHAESC